MAQFHENLKSKINDYIHLVYCVTKSFPKDELYGATSQIRRAALSVMLNYVEGYARGRDKVQLNFLEIAYGSLQESKYLLDFSLTEKYLNDADYKQAAKLADDIGAMLWGVLRGIKDNNQKAPNPKTHGSSSRMQDASFRTHDSNSKFQVASCKIQEKGQLALLSLLIIGAITLAAALSASFISRTEIGKGFRQSQIVTAQGAADSCMEEALYRLKSDSAYAGGNVNIGDGTCTITIINDSATVKSITVIGIVDKIRRKIEAKVQISPFKILSRTEAVTDACHQTDWGGSISSASASHNNGDQTGWTNYESENSTGKLVFDNGEVKMAHHDYSWTQTDDSSVKAADGITGVCVLNGVKVNPEVQCIADSDCAGTSGAYCEPGFNISGATFENTKIRGSGNVADIELSGYFPRDGDLVVSSGTFNLQTDLRNSRTKGDMVAAKLTEDAQIGLNVIKVADSSGFASRDNVMIITMYDNVAANLDTIGITNTTTKTITLASATANMSSFPASGVLKIDNEYIVYVSKDDATKTFTAGDPPNGRGAYGSTAATHAAGAQIIRWTVGQYKEAKVMNVNGTTITLNGNLTIFFPSSSAASSCASNPCTQLR